MSDKLDLIQKDISEIKTDLAVMRVDVNTHIRRTDLLEAQIEPLKEQSSQIRGAVTFIKICALLATLAEVIHISIK